MVEFESHTALYNIYCSKLWKYREFSRFTILACMIFYVQESNPPLDQRYLQAMHRFHSARKLGMLGEKTEPL